MGYLQWGRKRQNMFMWMNVIQQLKNFLKNISNVLQKKMWIEFKFELTNSWHLNYGLQTKICFLHIQTHWSKHTKPDIKYFYWADKWIQYKTKKNMYFMFTLTKLSKSYLFFSPAFTAVHSIFHRKYVSNMHILFKYSLLKKSKKDICTKSTNN